MTVKSNTTVIRVEFFSWESGRISMDAGSLLTTTSLVSYMFEKRLGTPTGGLTLVMKGEAQGCRFSDPMRKNGEPWLDLLQEGDWWRLVIQRNGQLFEAGMGKIDTITVGLAQDRGATLSTITVRGRDIGFGLEDVPVYFNMFDEVAQNIVGSDMLQFLGNQRGPAGDVIRRMIEGMFGKRSQSQLYGSAIQIPPTLRYEIRVDRQLQQLGADIDLKYIDLVDFQIQPDLEGQVLVPQTMMNVQKSDSSVWDYAANWRNPMMNELFVEIDPSAPLDLQKAVVILREKPFVNVVDGEQSPWFDLPVAEVDAQTCSSVTLTKGIGRVNHLLVLGDLTGLFNDEVYGIYPPAYNSDSVDRYGLRRRTEQTHFFEQTSAESAKTLLDEWKGRIKDWNVLNHKYLQGNLNIGEVRPDIRVGMKIAITNGPLGNYGGLNAASGKIGGSTSYASAYTFYVEAVRYEGVFGARPRHSTMVEVSRGYIEGRRFFDILIEAAPWDEFSAKNFTNSGSKNTDKSKLSPISSSPSPRPPIVGPVYDPNKGGS